MKKVFSILLIICSFLMADDLSITFIGNNRGSLIPCQCSIPSGGWSRIATALKTVESPNINVAAGNQFFHHTPIPKEDQIFEQRKADLQASLLSELNFEVINIGQFDLCYGLKALYSLQERYHLNFISCNLMNMHDQLAFPPYHIVSSQGIDIMFIGICYMSNGFNFKIKDPLQALKELHDEGLFDEADLVILLADAPKQILSNFVKDYDGIDIIIGSKDHNPIDLPIIYKKTSLVQLGSLGKYFTTLSIHHNNYRSEWTDLTLLKQSIPTKEMDAGIDKKHQKRIKKNKRLFKNKSLKHPNHYIWNMLFLDDSIKDDNKIKNRVETLLYKKK